MTNDSGGHWIRPEKRLAIYERDGYACVHCGRAIEEHEVLTLDHIRPRSFGGSNHERNLVTACIRCNSSRQDRRFNRDAASKLLRQAARPIDIERAKRLMARRSA